MNDEKTYERYKEDYSQEYIRSTWDMAIGLQAVDGLEPSDYLKKLAEKNIRGEITNEEIESLLYTRYENQTPKEKELRIEESDKIANQIQKLLKSKGFSFHVVTFKETHRVLFGGVYSFAGQFREYDFSKKEAILGGDSAIYASFRTISDILKYDFDEEREKVYTNMTKEQVIRNIARFTSAIWQVHPFEEGNTRTTAVFIERYLNYKGFQVDNSLFKDNSLYFRNALVRSNCENLHKGIRNEMLYLEHFFENLLYKGSHSLRNRDLILPVVKEDMLEQKK